MSNNSSLQSNLTVPADSKDSQPIKALSITTNEKTKQEPATAAHRLAHSATQAKTAARLSRLIKVCALDAEVDLDFITQNAINSLQSFWNRRERKEFVESFNKQQKVLHASINRMRKIEVRRTKNF